MSNWPFIILVKYASRNRPDRFLDGLKNIYDTCAQPNYIRVLVTADLDDPTMCNQEMRDKINSYPNCEVIYGTSENKIHAINRDLDILPDNFKGWHIVANFSDDQRWTMAGWDDIIRTQFNFTSPDFSHYIAYRDPDTGDALSTLLIAGRKWIDTFGFIYDPIFVSLFCDNIVEEAAKHLGKYHYTGQEIYRHFNSAYNYPDFPKDDQFIQQQSIGWDVDMKLYHKIHREGGIAKYLEKFDLTPLK